MGWPGCPRDDGRALGLRGARPERPAADALRRDE